MRILPPSEHQPRATSCYEEVRARVLDVLPTVCVEHIGASAIRNAWSKGDLDVFVGVEAAGFNTAVRAIEAIGFRVKPDTHRDESLCMLETSAYALDVAIQLVALGSTYEFFRTFRDRLNADAQLVDRYNELKRSSGDLSAEAYRQRKAKFIEEVLASPAAPLGAGR